MFNNNNMLTAYHTDATEYMHTSLSKIYSNFGIEGLTRPPLHPNLFSFHSRTNNKTTLNPLIVERLRLALTEGWLECYNLNQMAEFFDDCDARIFALGSQVTCDNCGVGLGICWEMKPTETCLLSICYNCHDNLSRGGERYSSDYQADYCTECEVECGADMCRYCEGDTLGLCTECGEDCGARYCKRDYD